LQGNVVHDIKGWLETASKQGIIKINPNESEMLDTVLLGMTDVTAFDHPEKLNDKKFWNILRNMIHAVLK
jgi:hypothetical protein